MPRLNLQVSPSNDAHRTAVLESATQLEHYPISPQLADAIRSLLSDSNVKEAIRRSRWFQFNDSALYYFDAIDRISSADYCPTDSDVLHAYTKTTGISQMTFKVAECSYRVFDVGGTRSERRKWIRCFEKTSAVIFLVALSEYNQRLHEDESVVRSTSSLSTVLWLTFLSPPEPYAGVTNPIQFNIQFPLVR
jgi:guanine nucleotide-binding protein G(i) subunit alpha